MPHEITNRDGMFTVRQPAWHGLGEVLDAYPTRQQAQAITMPWEPVTEPVFRRIPYFDEDGVPQIRFEEIEDSKLVVRSDDGADLGVVGDGFEPVTNQELWDIAEALEGDDPTSVMYETAGTLKGGRKVWILLRLREPLMIKGDPYGGTIPYYALQNSHDGSGAFRGQATMTRIVCANTSQVADLDAQGRGTEYVFRHTKNVRERVEEARQALTGWRKSIQQYRLISEHLMSVKVTPEQRLEFVERFIPMPPPHAISPRVVHNVETARDQLKVILKSPTTIGIDHTAYGLVQASIEYLQWARKARSDESRFKRAYLDRNAIITDAVNLVREVAHA